MTAMDFTWLNEPRQWSADPLTVRADAGSDFWRLTGNGLVRDNGHLYGTSVTGDFSITATFSASTKRLMSSQPITNDSRIIT